MNHKGAYKCRFSGDFQQYQSYTIYC